MNLRHFLNLLLGLFFLVAFSAFGTEPVSSFPIKALSQLTLNSAFRETCQPSLANLAPLTNEVSTPSMDSIVKGEALVDQWKKQPAQAYPVRLKLASDYLHQGMVMEAIWTLQAAGEKEAARELSQELEKFMIASTNGKNLPLIRLPRGSSSPCEVDLPGGMKGVFKQDGAVAKLLPIAWTTSLA